MIHSLFSYLWVFILSITGISQELTDDTFWYDQFILGGFDQEINAITITQGGQIYVGGRFNLLNGLTASGIAMWDGEKWNTLKNGVSEGWNNGKGNVYAIAADDDKIYVGGDFTMAGDTPANRIAMWDGEKWHALGSGVDGEVHAIAVDNGNVYIGGYSITEAGGVAVQNVAKWDGQSWSAMGSGPNTYNFVYAMAAKNDTVYVGGGFKKAGEDTVNYVTFWDGSKWNSMGSGMNNDVYCLALGNDQVYAGGSFTEAGGEPAKSIAQWDGAKWSQVGNGVNSSVESMTVFGNDLYVGGRFIMADTINAARIVKWDGENWHPLGVGIEDPNQVLSYRVYAIAVDGENVYAGGDFGKIEGKEEKYFAHWNGQSWSGLGKIQDNSVDGDIYALAIDETDVYVGGVFIKAGGDTVNNIAKWDGQKWNALGEGLNNKVNVLAVHNGKLYAGGIFSASGDKSLIRIAMWDGENWNSLSEEGINNQVYALAFKGDTLYIGGNFTSAGDKWARRIAKWDGTEWHALGGDGSLDGAGGVDGYPGSYVTSIEVDQDTVYIGGFFGRAFYQDGNGFVRVKSIVKWDGKNWHATPFFHESITQQIVYDLSVRNGDIYVAGNFPRFGDWPAVQVKKLNGPEWIDIGDEFYYSGSSSYGNKLHSILEINGNVYVAGEPDLVGEKATNFVSKWDGNEWTSLGSGVNDHVYSLAVNSTHLYAGGRFTTAGKKGSVHLARYDMTGITTLNNDESTLVESYYLYQNYPNPFNPATTISYTLPKAAKVTVSVFNILGQNIAKLYSGNQKEGTYSLQWDASSYSSGLYFYQLKTQDFEKYKRMLLIK